MMDLALASGSIGMLQIAFSLFTAILLVAAVLLWKIRRAVGEAAHVTCSLLARDNLIVLPASSPEECSATRKLTMSEPRPFALAVAFALVEGWGFYREGFLMSFTRTDAMQKCKIACVSALKARINKNLEAGDGQLHKRLGFDWADFKGRHDMRREGLHDLVLEVVQAVIRALLQLPPSLDMMKIRDISANAHDLEDALAAGPIKVVLAFLGLRPFLPPSSKLRIGQEYLRDYIESGDWSEDCFCADVIAAGKANGVDARGCLAELLTGGSYNTANVLQVLVWIAVHGKEVVQEDGQNRTVLQELKDSFRACEKLTDLQLINPHVPVAGEASAARDKLHSWMHYAFLNFPNLRYVLRSDPATGEPQFVDISALNKSRTGLTPVEVSAALQDDGSTFAHGRFGCPGQSLARAALLLASRFLFSPDSPVHLGHVTRGHLDVGHGGLVSKLNVEWNSDDIPRSASCTSDVGKMASKVSGSGSVRNLDIVSGA
mmetsp:Transcript_48287/g.121609  ORF Transcript_48287/g.121609 Transcript_48287/m.121609 type:complete len:489 (+) Transcript_48287:75-1541(+)|eukprot:CAMPEP_0115219236 /NCGR_PEP_ID=MMETSP0270-20121206/26810_1 /TAXON_ID=71861 /ORGANISM="Scrippsiella trochoidea, Strain CCMP3099" /LENGTH=488 /DNA_ID=CAMNT_0002633219 /DNA_START=80 /DNA_END=1546 /DNA_ORIENTATION=-